LRSRSSSSSRRNGSTRWRRELVVDWVEGREGRERAVQSAIRPVLEQEATETALAFLLPLTPPFSRFCPSLLRLFARVLSTPSPLPIPLSLRSLCSPELVQHSSRRPHLLLTLRCAALSPAFAQRVKPTFRAFSSSRLFHRPITRLAGLPAC
jgi:hypothetical protein